MPLAPGWVGGSAVAAVVVAGRIVVAVAALIVAGRTARLHLAGDPTPVDPIGLDLDGPAATQAGQAAADALELTGT
jgi:hypothetical protein